MNTTTCNYPMPTLRIYYVLMDISKIHLTLTGLIRDLNLPKFPLFNLKIAASGDKLYLPLSCKKISLNNQNVL